jgi:tetratricopeptide (TPR) repeat protein
MWYIGMFFKFSLQLSLTYILMKRIFIIISFLLFGYNSYAHGGNDVINQDTSEVKNLNKQAYDVRLTNPDQSIVLGSKALDLAKKLNYTHGIAEAYRVTGIGQYYLNEPEEAINSYVSALSNFALINDKKGTAKVYNNIGNLYRDNDYDRSLEYFQKALDIGNAILDNGLIATAYLNLGNFYQRKKSFSQALKYYNQSEALFSSLRDSVNIIQCEQNKGVVYFNLNKVDMATKLLTGASDKAKERDLNESVASIDLTLTSIYIQQGKFDDADRVVKEGTAYAQITKDQKMIHDFIFTNYQLESQRKNYQKALVYLVKVFHLDSTDVRSSLTSQLNLFEIKNKQEEQQRENELNVQRIEYDRVKFWGVTTVAGLLLVMIGLLVSNVKRKAKTNLQLTELNGEVSRQKDNLDRINHHLEEIIDERTKDLQTKNRKLSEYSSYLSHQIRGPIATLKGLMNLEKEGLVDKQECISMMDKCVSEIDEKIIEMSDMMQDASGKVH